MARIVVADDCLHVVHRHGAIALRGKDLPRLHQRLAPVLDGRFSREQLLSSAGAHARLLQRYIDGLRASGALQERELSPDLPENALQWHPRLQELKAGRTRIAVALHGAEPADTGAVRVSFPTQAELEQRLLDLDRVARTTSVWIVCDREPDQAELARRAAVARHMLAIVLSTGGDRRLGIFRLAANRCRLQRLALVEPSTLHSLPARLGLLRMFDAGQVPLVSMIAEFPGSNRRMIAYGLDAKQIRAELATAFLGREALVRAARAGTVEGRLGRIGDSTVGRTVRLLPAQAARAVVAASPSRCLHDLVCAWALGHARAGAAREVDLLALKPPTDRVALLQDMVRRRRSTLPALLDERRAPLVTLRAAGRVVARLGIEEALAASLMQIVAAGYGFDGTAIACAPPLDHPRSARRRLRAALRGLPARLPVITGRFKRLGSTFFFGVIASR